MFTISYLLNHYIKVELNNSRVDVQREKRKETSERSEFLHIHFCYYTFPSGERQNICILAVVKYFAKMRSLHNILRDKSGVCVFVWWWWWVGLNPQSNGIYSCGKIVVQEMLLYPQNKRGKKIEIKKRRRKKWKALIRLRSFCVLTIIHLCKSEGRARALDFQEDSKFCCTKCERTNREMRERKKRLTTTDKLKAEEEMGSVAKPRNAILC